MKRLSRKQKLLIWCIVLICSAIVLFLNTAPQSSSAKISFRLAEKKNMIGPAKIIADIPFPHGPYDRILIGESDYGYTFYEWRNSGDRMNYVEKAEGVTLYCTYSRYGSEKLHTHWLPIFALVDHPAAVSAKLTITTIHSGETVSYPLLADRSSEGYFLFSWDTLELRSYDFWLVQQCITGAYSEYILDGSAEITLELFDRNGMLLETHSYTK